MCIECILRKIGSKSIQTRTHKLETIQKYQMLSHHKSHIFLHIIWNAINLRIMLFTNRSNLLYHKITVLATEIMKDDRDLELFWVNP